MPVYESTVDNVLGSDAEFQAYVQDYEAAILASGFLEVAPDTGQLNPLTIAKPAVVSTWAGYRIYRATDAMAPTKPIYIKVEYGVGAAVDRFAVRRTTATGTNGAGTLTGVTSAVGSIHAPSISGGGTGMIYGGGNESHMWLMTWDTGQPTHCSFWMCGRLIDQDDGESDEPVFWDFFTATSSSTLAGAYQWTDGSTAWAVNSSGVYEHLPNLGHAINTGGDVNTILLYQGMVYRNAKTKVFPFLAGRAAELPFTDPAGSQFNLNLWGASRTFLAIPFSAVISGMRIAVLWEE